MTQDQKLNIAPSFFFKKKKKNIKRGQLERPLRAQPDRSNCLGQMFFSLLPLLLILILIRQSGIPTAQI